MILLHRHETPALRDRTGRGIGVAVIDSGIHARHPHVRGVAGGVAIDPDGSFHDDFVDRLGHGTAVAAAIQEKAPDVDLWVVRVFHDRLATRLDALVRAIEWAGMRGIRLINLSLGTPRPEHAERLAEAVAAAARNGSLIVAAAEHERRAWWPGALPAAVGVRADPECPRHAVRLDSAAGALGAAPWPRPIPGVPPERNLSGISFAVANATGLLALALEGEAARAGAGEVLRELERLDGRGRPAAGPAAARP